MSSCHHVSVALIYDRMAVAMAGHAGRWLAAADCYCEARPDPTASRTGRTEDEAQVSPSATWRPRTEPRLDADGDHGPDGGVTAALIQ
jgi:hypothetical protein